mmetsp:Transcript_113512/g.331694  ORF Transcript_113512/g.331694 Transcript_113512/m.331694 type:complete len:236 (+) Transcript_113512:849-1556(+)
MGLCLLVLVVGLQSSFIALDHGLQACFWLLNSVGQVCNLTLKRGDLARLRVQIVVVRRPLRVAPSKLLIIRPLLRCKEVDHLLDLCKDGGEGIVGLEHGGDPAQQQGLAGAGGLPQQGLRLLPLRVLPLDAMAMPLDGPALEEGCGTLFGCCDLAEGLEGGITVEDRDGLRNGGFLVRPERRAFLVLRGLLSADGKQLLQESLCLPFLPLGIRQLSPLRGKGAVVGAQASLLGLV